MARKSVTRKTTAIEVVDLIEETVATVALSNNPPPDVSAVVAAQTANVDAAFAQARDSNNKGTSAQQMLAYSVMLIENAKRANLEAANDEGKSVVDSLASLVSPDDKSKDQPWKFDSKRASVIHKELVSAFITSRYEFAKSELKSVAPIEVDNFKTLESRKIMLMRAVKDAALLSYANVTVDMFNCETNAFVVPVLFLTPSSFTNSDDVLHKYWIDEDQFANDTDIDQLTLPLDNKWIRFFNGVSRQTKLHEAYMMSINHVARVAISNDPDGLLFTAKKRGRAAQQQNATPKTASVQPVATVAPMVPQVATPLDLAAYPQSPTHNASVTDGITMSIRALNLTVNRLTKDGVEFVNYTPKSRSNLKSAIYEVTTLHNQLTKLLQLADAAIAEHKAEAKDKPVFKIGDASATQTEAA
jgi:hypothetical protein